LLQRDGVRIARRLEAVQAVGETANVGLERAHLRPGIDLLEHRAQLARDSLGRRERLVPDASRALRGDALGEIGEGALDRLDRGAGRNIADAAREASDLLAQPVDLKHDVAFALGAVVKIAAQRAHLALESLNFAVHFAETARKRRMLFAGRVLDLAAKLVDLAGQLIGALGSVFTITEERLDVFRGRRNHPLDFLEPPHTAFRGNADGRRVGAGISRVGARIEGLLSARDVQNGVGERKLYYGRVGLGAAAFRLAGTRRGAVETLGAFLRLAIGVVNSAIVFRDKAPRRRVERRAPRAPAAPFDRRRDGIVLDELGDDRLEGSGGASLARADAAAQSVQRLIQAARPHDAVSALVDELRDPVQGPRRVALVRGDASRAAKRRIVKWIVHLIVDRERRLVVLKQEVVLRRIFVVESAPRVAATVRRLRGARPGARQVLDFCP